MHVRTCTRTRTRARARAYTRQCASHRLTSDQTLDAVRPVTRVRCASDPLRKPDLPEALPLLQPNSQVTMLLSCTAFLDQTLVNVKQNKKTMA